MTNDKFIPILCLDFDGVIHDYREGWKDGTIYGDVTPGFFEWAERAADVFQLVVHSSRFKTENDIQAAKQWLVQQASNTSFWAADELLPRIQWSQTKPPAWVTIDDRAITFDGDWRKLDVAGLRQFKPWNAR